MCRVSTNKAADVETANDASWLESIYLAATPTHTNLRGAFMKRHTIAAILLVLACGAMACQGEPNEQATIASNEAPLVITNRTPTTLEGTFSHDAVLLDFQAIEVAPRKVDITIQVDEATLEFQ